MQLQIIAKLFMLGDGRNILRKDVPIACCFNKKKDLKIAATSSIQSQFTEMVQVRKCVMGVKNVSHANGRVKKKKNR